MLRNIVRSVYMLGCGLLLLAGTGQGVRADVPVATLLPPLTTDEQTAGKKEVPKQPDKEKTPPPKTPSPGLADLFASTASQQTQAPLVFHPHMMGDLPGTFAQQTITVTGQKTITTTTTTTTFDSSTESLVTKTTTTTKTVPFSQTRVILVPTGGAVGAFKVGENDSPRPVDRVFFTWNYYGNLNAGATGGAVNTSQTSSFSSVDSSSTTTINTLVPPTPRFTGNLNRETLGFEKTFLDGFASIELRVPILQQQGNIDGFTSSNVGDLTILGKYAFILDQVTGNVLSAGFAVTAPTGPAIATIDGTLHSTLLQPWFGYIWNADRFFLQAFHSVVVPTDSRDVTLLLNDVSINFWLYRGTPNGYVRFVVPTLETHITTPLNHRDFNGPIFCPDIVDLTGGFHLGLGRNSVVTVGVATPVTGPRPFSIEAFVQWNWIF